MLHAAALYHRSPSSPLHLFKPRILSVCTNLSCTSLFRTPHNRQQERTLYALLSLPCDRLKQTSSRHCSSMSPVPEFQQSDLFRYTSGRWLWDEEKQLSERYRRFNVQNLERIAAECVHAEKCIETKKIGEGSYNKVFRLVFDTGAVVIARIPNPNAGPALYTTASEVATMEFVRNNLIPFYRTPNSLTNSLLGKSLSLDTGA